MKVRICSECGEHNLAQSWYCSKCGETLSINTLTDMKGDLVRHQSVEGVSSSESLEHKPSSSVEVRDSHQVTNTSVEQDLSAAQVKQRSLATPTPQSGRQEKAILGSVACSFPDCANPVIGQCTGYEHECRKFYCAIHSDDTLCYQCAEQKFADGEAERTKQDYLNTIQTLRRQARSLTWRLDEVKWIGGISLALGIVGLLTSNSEAGPALCGLGFLGLVVTLIVVSATASENEKRLATEIDQQKNGFLDFYNGWKKEEQKKALGVIGAIIGFIFLAALAGLVSEAEKSSEDARVRRTVDDELGRRGM